MLPPNRARPQEPGLALGTDGAPAPGAASAFAVALDAQALAWVEAPEAVSQDL